MGNREASVTTPKPVLLDPPVETIRQTPIPRAKTSGTVTGPVVTAPQSHAKPSTCCKRASEN